VGSETVRNLGFESGIEIIQALVPQSIADATPVLSAAIDTAAYPRKRFLVVWSNKEATATTHTMALTVTESATSGGSYTAASTSGTLTAISADGAQFASIRRNRLMPFLKITLTGSHADVDTISTAVVLAIPDYV
jgi:hypothetical protein